VKTYGTVTYLPDARVWRVDCESHVRGRLKRVFEKLARAETENILITANLETARELQWFLTRFPMEMSDEDRAKLAQDSTEYEARQQAIVEILSTEFVPREFTLHHPPRQYQAVGAELLLRTGRELNEDELGLGKTVIAIASMTDPRTRPALVAVMAHLQKQWREQLFKFAPDLRVHTLKKIEPYPIPGNTDVLISSYDKLRGWTDALAGKMKMVVFDEAQQLRVAGSQKYEAAAAIARAADFRLGLTATPVYNYGDEMYNILDVLEPGCLGTRAEFGREWCVGGQAGRGARIANPRVFGSYLKDQGLVLRRTRREVGRELPPVSKLPHYVDADPAVLDKIKNSAAELARIVLSRAGVSTFERMQASEELSTILRQATGIAKAPYVALFVRMLVEAGEKVILYGWHHAVYDLWKEALRDLKPVMFTGQESPTQKEQAKARFIGGDSNLMIMSLRAGAGLDGLQGKCRTVVFGELDWAPGVHDQCIGRIHRDGQKEPVMAYFLITDVGSDPVVVDVLGIKKQQAEGVVDPNADLIETLHVDEEHIKKLAEHYLSQQDRPVPAGQLEMA
jgi:SNF2 family DNA or RNA helicase